MNQVLYRVSFKLLKHMAHLKQIHTTVRKKLKTFIIVMRATIVLLIAFMYCVGLWSVPKGYTVVLGISF